MKGRQRDKKEGTKKEKYERNQESIRYMKKQRTESGNKERRNKDGINK
jgi:hypothetical protein